MKLRFALLLLLTLPLAAQDHWVATWTTAQPMLRSTRGGLKDQTVRMIVHTSIGGSKVRLKFTNGFGATPVTLAAAHVALRAKGAEIVPASDHAVTFNGKASTTIGPGMVILSDAVTMAVPAQGDLAVSVCVAGDTGPASAHNALHTTYVASGDQTAAVSMADATTAQADYFLESVDVLAPAATSLIVALGDSITEGHMSTPDTDRTWPALLSARLSGFAVTNMGIGGNRVLRDGSGASALARFDRDVLSQSGVKWLMFLEGINDIGHANTDPVTADDLIGAYKQIIERAHSAGIRVVGCTLPPFAGAGYYREEGEAIRSAVNNWIRTSKAYDAVADFDAAARDPNDPRRLRAEFDPGDHLHPNDAGYKAMANAVDLAIFSVR